MSQTIENRIVEMDFENKSFERNANQSIATLEALKNSLDLSSATKNLQNFGTAANRVDLSGLTNAVEGLSSKFSTLRYVGLHVLGNIVDTAMSAGHKIASALTTPINQIKQGGLSRALNIEQASFLLEGLGLDVKEIKQNALDAVKGTAFGFDEAAKVAASFGASGIKAGEEMKQALLGVSGVAAMTGKSYEEIGHIFSTIASNGKLMTIQLRQFSYAGLNVASVLGKALGKTEEEINDMVTKGKIDFKTFSEVMTKEFGEHSKKANDTYTGSLANVKAALSRIGADVATPYLEHMRDIFNSLTTFTDNFHEALGPLINDINNGMGKAADKLLKFIQTFDRLGIAKNFLEGIRNIFWSLMLVLEPIKQAFQEVFPETLISRINNFSKSFKEFSTKLVISESAAEAIRSTSVKIFTLLSNLFGIIKKIFDFVIPDVDRVRGHVEKITEIISSLKEKFSGLTNLFQKKSIGDKMKEEADKVQTSSDIITNAFDKIKNVFSKMFSSDSKIVGYIDKIKEAVVGAVEFVKGVFSGKKEKNPLNIEGILLKIWNVVKMVFGGIASAIKNITKNTDFFDLISLLESGSILLFFTKLNSALKKIGKDNPFKSLTTGIKDFFSSISGTVRSYANTKDTPIGKMFGAITDNVKKMQASVKSDILLKIAIAIGVLAGSFYLISKIDMESAAVSFAVISGLILEISFAASALVKILSQEGAITKGMGSLILIAISIGILAKAVKQLGSLDLEDLIKGIGGLTVVMILIIKFTDMMSHFNKKGIKSITKTSAILIKIGIALNIMALAVRQLASLSIEELAKGLISIGGLLASIIAFFYLITKLDEKSIKSITKISGLLIEVGIALNIIALAVRQLGSIEHIGQGLISLAVVLLEIFAFFALMSEMDAKNIESIKAASTQMLKVGIALNIITLAVKQLASLSLVELGKGLGSIAVILVEVFGFFFLINKFSPNADSLTKIGASLILMSIGIKIISSAVSNLASADLAGIGASVLALGVLLGILTVVAEKLSGLENLGKASLSIIAFSLAIRIISSSISSLASADLAGIGASTLALSVMLGVLYIVMQKLAAMNPQIGFTASNAIIMMASSLGMIASAIKKVAGLDLAGIGAAVLGLSVMLGVLVIATERFAAIQGIGKAALSMMALSFAVLMLAPALLMLSQLSIGGAITGILTLAAALAVLIVAAYAAEPVAVILLAVAGALTLVGVAIAAAGAGFFMIAAGMTLIAAVGVLFANAVVRIVEAIAPLATIIGTAIAEVLVSFANVLVQGYDTLIQLGATIIGAIVEGFAQNIPRIIEAGTNVIVSFLQGLAEKMPDMVQYGLDMLKSLLEGIARNIKMVVTHGMDIALNFIKGIAEKLPDIIQAGYDLILSLINGIADGIRNNTDALIEATDNLMTAIWEAMMKWFDHFGEVGENILAGIGQGIKDGWNKLKETVVEFAGKVVNKFKEIFKIASPSKETYYDGEMLDAGLEDGIRENSDGPLQVSTDLGNGVMANLGDALNTSSDLPQEALNNIRNNTVSVMNDIGSASDVFAERYGNNNKKIANSISDVSVELVDGKKSWREWNSTATSALEIIEKNEKELERLRKEYAAGRMSTEEYNAACKNLEDEIEELLGDVDALKEALAGLDNRVAAAKKTQTEATKKYEEGSLQMSEYALIMKETSDAINTATKLQDKYGKSVDDTKDSTKEATDANDAYSKSLGGTGSAAKEAKSDLDELRDSLKSTIESQFKIFDKFEEKTAMSKDELLSNMRGQIKGMAEWATNINKISRSGIEQGLLLELEKLGPDGRDKVAAFASMTEAELAEANQLWIDSLTIKDMLPEYLLNAGQQSGMNMALGLQEGLMWQSATALEAFRQFGADAIGTFNEETGIQSPSTKMFESGMNLIFGLVNGINYFAPVTLYPAVRAMAMAIIFETKNALQAWGDYSMVFYEIGAYIVEGLRLGIEENAGAAIEVATALAIAIAEAFESASPTGMGEGMIGSPSPVFRKFGAWIDEGLALGIKDKTGTVVNSVEDMATEAINSMKSTIATISSMVNDEFEDPVITPILDLSNVRAGARTLSNAFSTNQALLALASMSGLQNGQYSANGPTFIQNNYSPKSLSRKEIYRDSRNLVSKLKAGTLA